MSWKIIYIVIILAFGAGLLVFMGVPGRNDSAEVAEVKLYDTHGHHDDQRWTRILNTEHRFADPEHLVMENAYFRVTYPSLHEGQQAGFSYFVKVRNEWMRVTDLKYGDYTYFVDSIQDPPASIRIVKNTSDEVILAFTYNHKNYRPEIAANRTYIGDLELTKIMSLQEGYPGVFVRLQSVPPNPDGEREIGFGIGAPVIFSERTISQHPLAGYHVNLEMDKARSYYGVSLPLSDSFYRILVLSNSMKTLAYQPISRKEGARLIVNRLVESGRDRYQVFLGAIPFDSSRSLQEFEAFQQFGKALEESPEASGGQVLKMKVNGINQGQIPFNIDPAGDYRLVLRGRNPKESAKMVIQIDDEAPITLERSQGKQFKYVVIADRFFLSAGKHMLNITLEQGEFECDNFVVLPILNKRDFPLDVVHNVLPEMYVMRSRFEAEDLYRQTGGDVQDTEASNDVARFASDGDDSPDFLVFRPVQKVVLSGKYVVTFYMKVNDNTVAESVAALDVFSRKTGILAQRRLRGKDWEKAGMYQAFALEFTIPSTYPREVYELDFRVYFTGKADIWVDYIELVSEEIPQQD